MDSHLVRSDAVSICSGKRFDLVSNSLPSADRNKGRREGFEEFNTLLRDKRRAGRREERPGQGCCRQSTNNSVSRSTNAVPVQSCGQSAGVLAPQRSIQVE